MNLNALGLPVKHSLKALTAAEAASQKANHEQHFPPEPENSPWEIDRVLRLWGASVQRWHSCRSIPMQRSGDTTAAHTTRCLWLLHGILTDPPAPLIYAVLFHDIGECVAGDVSGLTKREFPALAEALASVERTARANLEISPSHYEAVADWVHLVDMLDAYLWVRAVHPAYLTDPSWRTQIEDIVGLADILCVGEKVRMLLA